MARPSKPAMNGPEYLVALDNTLRQAAWKISEMRGAAHNPKARVSRQWVLEQLLEIELSGNPPVRKPAFGQGQPLAQVLSANQPELCDTGSPLSKPATPEALEGINRDSLGGQQAQETGPEAVLEDASAKGAAK